MSAPRSRLAPDTSSSNSVILLICGATILTLAMGIRQTFGLFLTPMALDLGLNRETFGLALAIQNLLWGALQPWAGMVADRYGIRPVLLVGTATYSAGLMIMATGGNAMSLSLGAGFAVGIAMSCVSFAIILGAIGRGVAPERRSMALGIASAGGSFGQFAMAPIGHVLITQFGWSNALLGLAAIALSMAPLSLLLAQASAKTEMPIKSDGSDITMRQALVQAGRDRDYQYLNAGFFVCGFQVVFVGVHLPAYLIDLGLPSSVGATALALIGLFNIVGTWACGMLGGRHSKKYLLSGLYLLRALAIAVFVIVPKTEVNVLVFASVLGFLWLGTVPLTSGLVAHIFGVRYLSTLFGFVFLSHQVGSFLGVWLGGVVYDQTGSYDPIWYASIVLGVIAAMIHLPISEQRVTATA